MLEKYSGLIALAILIVCLVIFLRYKANQPLEDEEEEEVKPISKKVLEASPLNLNDEDATVAALIASIDYYQEIKKDVRVVSVKEI